MATPKVRGRQGEDRPSTSTRVFVDTLEKLKFLANLDNLTIADVLDRLVGQEFARRRKELHAAIDRLAAEGGRPDEKKGQ